MIPKCKLYRFLLSLFASISMPFSWDSYYLYLILLFGCTKKSIGINVIIAIIIHILVQVKVVRRITVERLYFPKKYSFSNVVPLPFHCRYLQCIKVLWSLIKIKDYIAWSLHSQANKRDKIQTVKCHFSLMYIRNYW